MANTQTVTILFTDMVGSTELSSLLGPESSDKLRQAHFSLLRQVLAGNDGTEVKNLGDGLMAVFASPSAAVASAVAMQQAVEQGNRRSSSPLGLRIGMSVGEVTKEDDDYFGDPVVEAARLCALCEGGQVFTTETVRSMAGRRSPHPFDSVGERALKGLPEPVAVFEVGWDPAAIASGVPLPDRLETQNISLFEFVGREREKALLIEAVKGLTEGTRHVAFLSGEPGIGKTSLCKQLAHSAHELGVCVLYGRSDEDLGASYRPFAEALTHLVVHADESLLAEHVSDHGGALLSLVSALAKRLPGIQPTQSADPDSERLRLFGAAVNLLSLASAEGGLLLVIDDLHWADKASLQLLRHICASNQLPNVMVLGTYRDSELSAGDPLSDTLASISRETYMGRFDLLGLEDIEIIAMMEAVTGQTLDQDGVDLAHAVKRETEGNPFFTTELLRHLGETGLVYQDDTGRWVASDDLHEKGLPQSVRQVVGQRVDRLGEDVRKVLSQAAVIGREFDIEVLAAVAGMDEDAVLDIVDEGVQAGLLTEVEGIAERLSFTHALVQHTLYEDFGAARRARAHRRIADVLEQFYGTTPESRAAELAHHFLAATKSVDIAKAVKYCKMAGDQALAQVASADAVGWFVQALDLYPQLPADKRLHCDLLIGLGTAQIRTGDPAHRQTLLDAAAIAGAMGDRDRLVGAALANNRGGAAESGHVDHDRVAVLETALEAVGAHDSSERAQLLAILGCELIFESFRDRAFPLMSDALAMARRLDDPVCFLRVTDLVHSSPAPETVEERLADLARAITLAQALGDPKASFRAHMSRANTCLQVADRSDFDSHFRAAVSLAERVDEPFVRWQGKSLEAMHSFLTGDLDRSQQEAEAALSLGTQGVPEAMSAYAVALMDINRIRGNWSEVAEMAELMAAYAAENPGLPALRAGLAATYCDLGRDDDARAVINDDLDDGFAAFPDDYLILLSLGGLSEVCFHLRSVDGAALVYERLAPWRSQVIAMYNVVDGPVAVYLGKLASLLGRGEEANEHFTEALDISHKLDSPYWIARTQIEWARLLRERGEDRAKAESMRESALRTARRHGFGALVEQAETHA
jgi:class 3 adenylate cyclase